LTAAQAAANRASADRSRLLIPGVAIAALLFCAICVAASSGGLFALQGEDLLAQLGLSATPETPTAVDGGETPAPPPGPDSPLPTPTISPEIIVTDTPALSATATPTDIPLLATNTPVSTNTPAPTDTPVPTKTPIPTNTPAAPPTRISPPTDTPTPAPPADTPTPAMKYGPPKLLEPPNDFAFIQGNTIVLRWEPVGELAPDEQYAVRLAYLYQGKTVYGGTQLKEPEWTVPNSLFGQIDPPDNRYEWFVVVERLQDDGSGTAISPESERRTFTWK
jgi:hypothetical protein